MQANGTVLHGPTREGTAAGSRAAGKVVVITGAAREFRRPTRRIANRLRRTPTGLAEFGPNSSTHRMRHPGTPADRVLSPAGTEGREE